MSVDIEKFQETMCMDIPPFEKGQLIKQWQLDNNFNDEMLAELINGWNYTRDIKTYCRECLRIRDKNGNIIALVPNEHQDKIIDIVESWKKQYPDPLKRPTLFIMILKARQVGFSTIVEAIFFHELNYSKNKVAMIVSYDEESAKNINDMSDRYYQYLPKTVKPLRRPSRGKGILFENPDYDDRIADSLENTNPKKNPGLQSKFLIDTARNKNAGSSYTIHYLHVSELAKWPDAEATLTSLLQAVPQYGGIVVIESTANGIETFHKLWKEAKRGELNYETIFVGWHEHKEYSLDFKDSQARRDFVASLKEDEYKLKDQLNLTYEQLFWRRETIKKKCQNNKDIFNQEYPYNDTIAFLTSGRPVFDREKIENWKHKLELKYMEKPYETGYIEYNKGHGRYEFFPDEFGTVKIYEHPKPGYPYVIGGDIAEGLLHGDWSVSPVCDNTTGIIVAKLRLHIHPDLLADEQIKLARYYNQALIANEVNNHGLTTITSLQKQGYYHQYKREVYDKISKTKLQKFGFDTKGTTLNGSRKKAINALRAIVRDNIEWITDIEILDEMLTFIYNSEGKEEGEKDCHDDCVLATAIMYAARGQASQLPPKHDITIKGRKTEMVHPSIYADTHNNPKLKEYYKNKYEAEVAKLYGIHNIFGRRV
jgi:hypothetical protein